MKRIARVLILVGLIGGLAFGGSPLSAQTTETRINGSASAAGETESVAPPVTSSADGIILNFEDASFATVLNYLSEAVGFVIVQEAEISGTVNVKSLQPMSQEEVVDLLNTLLLEKGFIAIRNGRILKIVSRADAAKRDLPVRSGSDPGQIPRKDEMVTQIIPVRYADAMKLVQNISPLLVDDATLTANESSNAIVLTDTSANVRRIAEIIRALDTSIAGISAIRVFPLEYADAKELAEVVKELFQADSSSSSRRGADMRAMFERMRGGRGGGEGNGATGTSEARQAAARVVAVADERSNSLIVTAPEEMMPTIEQLVKEIDTSTTDVSEVRIFRLENADAVEIADLLSQLYEDEDLVNNQARSGGGRPPFFGGRGGGSTTQQSQRTLQQTKVIVVGDPRTNSLLVSAGRETMMQIAETVGRLDANSDKKQQVHVYSLEHADVDNVATILRGMFDERYSNTRNTQTENSRLSTRSTSGASQDVRNTSFGTRQGGRQ